MLVGCWLAIGQKGTCLLLARGGEDSRNRKYSTWRSSSILQFCSAAGLLILVITVDQFRTDSYCKSYWSLCKNSLRYIVLIITLLNVLILLYPLFDISMAARVSIIGLSISFFSRIKRFTETIKIEQYKLKKPFAESARVMRPEEGVLSPITLP